MFGRCLEIGVDCFRGAFAIFIVVCTRMDIVKWNRRCQLGAKSSSCATVTIRSLEVSNLSCYFLSLLHLELWRSPPLNERNTGKQEFTDGGAMVHNFVII